MKYPRPLPERIVFKRYLRRLESKRKRKAKRSKINFKYNEIRKILNKDFSYYNVLYTFLPKNLKYLLLECETSHLYVEKLLQIKVNYYQPFIVPKNFSLIDNPVESYSFIEVVLSGLILQVSPIVSIDYSQCKNIDLDAQIYLDILIKDVISFYKRCREHKKIRPQVKQIKGINVRNHAVRKLLFSVGSPVIHSRHFIRYDDIIPYNLCIHNSLNNSQKNIGKKDIDTTNLVDYVLECLHRLNRKLTDEKREDLCVVISEILINAEEHSSLKYRFSIGYFNEKIEGDIHCGIFRLVIMNFGQTIYEKFKDPSCPNSESINKMKAVSKRYNRNKLFSRREFEEETLWTLYSLQEGITSTDPKVYKKRGNGSIRFIDSFFKIKGKNSGKDNVSRMAITSGNTEIVFDGTYDIMDKVTNGERFQVMTFNKNGNIMEKPDSKFVRFVDHYFAGTLIYAEILFNEKDFENEQ